MIIYYKIEANIYDGCKINLDSFQRFKILLTSFKIFMSFLRFILVINTAQNAMKITFINTFLPAGFVCFLFSAYVQKYYLKTI